MFHCYFGDCFFLCSGEEAGKIQYEGLLMEKKNLPTKTHNKIIAYETNTHGKFEKLKRIHRDGDGRKTEPSLGYSWEQVVIHLFVLLPNFKL